MVENLLLTGFLVDIVVVNRIVGVEIRGRPRVPKRTDAAFYIIFLFGSHLSMTHKSGDAVSRARNRAEHSAGIAPCGKVIPEFHSQRALNWLQIAT